MSKSDFAPGARVVWGGEEYVVWSLHRKSSWRWLAREGRTVEALVKSLALVAPAPDVKSSRKPRRLAAVATNPHDPTLESA